MVNFPLQFTKISATGNDFILFDNREHIFSGEEADFFRSICRRRFSIGADGILLIETSQAADFRMRYFNADGKEAEMCGNGARGCAYWAYTKGIVGEEMTIQTLSGVQKAWLKQKRVKLTTGKAEDLRFDVEIVEVKGLENGGAVRVGVPHFVIFAERVAAVDVFTIGTRIRHHPSFQPQGTNVNFVEVVDGKRLRVRTYERGVEEETLSCGTGAAAAAVVATFKKGLKPPIEVITRGGSLTVDFPGDLSEILLEGEVEIVYEGVISQIANSPAPTCEKGRSKSKTNSNFHII